MNLYEAQRANRRKTYWMMLFFVLFFCLLGFGLDYFYLGYGRSAPPLDPLGGDGDNMRLLPRSMPYPFATGLAFVISFVYAAVSYFTGDKLVLASTQARKIQEPANAQEKQLLNVVDEITIASGMPRPRVYIVPDMDPNAFATGRDPQHASIAVTQGLLASLNREELQGVIAHELSHVRNHDIRCMTMLAALVGAIGLISDWTMRGMFSRGQRSRSSSSSRNGGGIILFAMWILAAILAPILARLLAMAVSRQREYLADASGAELTRNPLGLASALIKLERASEPTRTVKQGMAHLCIVDPLGLKLSSKEGFTADLFATHPPIAKRIERLKAMGYVA